MRNHVAREECDTTDEICALFNEVLQEVLANRQAINGLSEKEEKREKAVKKAKGGRT